MYIHTRYYVDVSTQQAAVFAPFWPRTYTLRSFDGGAGGRRASSAKRSRNRQLVEDPNYTTHQNRASRAAERVEIETGNTTTRGGSEAAAHAHAQCPAVWGADWSYSALLSITTIYTGPIPVQHL